MRFDWRPAIGTKVHDQLGAFLYEVIAHVPTDYGDCVVVKRKIPGGFGTQLLTRSQWEHSYDILRVPRTTWSA